jgi:chromosome segregation ATPase
MIGARRADVSRTFIYDNPEARTAVPTAMAESGERRSQMLAEQDDEHEATWRERALNAEDALKAAQTEILSQRTRIGELLGQVRDLQAEWTEEAIQRITTENTTLKQRVRQLTADNRTLDERLKAARSNLRFQDRRIADLEAASPNRDQQANPFRLGPADVSAAGHTRAAAAPGHRSTRGATWLRCWFSTTGTG